MLLVHGFASSFERNWREPGWVDLLAESGREVIGVDLPGHGTGRGDGAGRGEAVDPASLAEVTCPVLVVLGDRDFAGPAGPLLDALADARLVEIRGLDHFATPKDFRFVDAALDFLGRPRSGGGTGGRAVDGLR